MGTTPDEDYILDFICRNIKLLDEWHINLVFKFAFYKGDWTKQNIFHKIAIALSKEKINYVLKDGKLFKQLLYEHEHRDKVDINHMVYLYNFLEPKFQEELKKLIFENLKENTDDSIELWFQSVNEGVADLSNEMPENLLTTFERYFDEIQNLGINEDGEIIMNHSTVPSNLTYRFAEFLSNNKIGNKTYQYLLTNSKTPDIFKWILDPQNFNYKKFNCYWVIVFSNTSILEKLAELNIIQVKKVLRKSLKDKYSPKLAKAYFKYFV